MQGVRITLHTPPRVPSHEQGVHSILESGEQRLPGPSCSVVESELAWSLRELVCGWHTDYGPQSLDTREKLLVSVAPSVAPASMRRAPGHRLCRERLDLNNIKLHQMVERTLAVLVCHLFLILYLSLFHEKRPVVSC